MLVVCRNAVKRPVVQSICPAFTSLPVSEAIRWQSVSGAIRISAIQEGRVRSGMREEQ